MKRAKCWRIVADDIKLFPRRSRVVGRVLMPEQKAQLFQTAGILNLNGWLPIARQSSRFPLPAEAWS